MPVEHIGRPILINEVRIANKSSPDWARRHWLTFKRFYSRAPFWKEYCDFFEQTYNQEWIMLIDLNIHLMRGLVRFFKIDKPFVFISSLNVSGEKSDFVLNMCKKMHANVYLSGNGGREYLNLERFEEAGIEVVFQDFHHPIYKQLYGDFVSNLSAIDYLFNTGGTMFHEE